MRTYSNFLLFEDVLTNLPDGSVLIKSVADTLMAPSVKVVENDCGTFLGNIIPVDYTAVGQVELANRTPLTVSRITTLKSLAINTIRVRSLHTCVSKGGICGTCYEATFGTVPRVLDGTWALDGSVPLNGRGLPTVGTIVQAFSEYIYKTDVIIGDGISDTYPITQSSDQYLRTNYDPLLYPVVVSISDTEIKFASVRTPADIFVLHYYTLSSNPFLEYIAKSFSGGIFGISPLPSYPTMLKPSLYQSMFSDSQISMMKDDLLLYTNNLPSSYVSYCDTIRDPLEKILFIIYLYAIYANISAS